MESSEWIATQRPSAETLHRIGRTLLPFTRWFDETPQQSHSQQLDPGRGLNDSYRPEGLAVTLIAWEMGARRVTPSQTTPLTAERLANLLPADVTAFEVGFSYVGSAPRYPGESAITIRYSELEPSSYVRVDLPDEGALDVLDQVRAILQEFPPPVGTPAIQGPANVFIGHGNDHQWLALRDAIDADPDLRVEAFEENERATEATLDVVMGMVARSEVAVIVMTGAELITGGGGSVKRARPNVVHELGLAQGQLGKGRVVVVLEEGTEYPSNIEGHIQVRFESGNIYSLRDRVVAAIKRRIAVEGRRC